MGEITAQQDTIAALYDPDEFVGRGWLRAEAERLRADPNRRRLIVVGEPGSGKSTFLASLAQAWNCPRYFIRGGPTGGVTGTDPHSFLISRPATVSTLWPGTVRQRRPAVNRSQDPLD